MNFHGNNLLNIQLQYIQEKEELLQELKIDKDLLGVGLLVLWTVAFRFLMLFQYFFISKISKKWSAKLSQVMKKKEIVALVRPAARKWLNQPWKVRVYPMEDANAFCLPAKGAIFVTKGLLKGYTDDEIMAIILHEVGHIVGLQTKRLDLAHKARDIAIVAFLVAIFKSKTVGRILAKHGPYINVLFGLKLLIEATFQIRIEIIGTIIAVTLGRRSEWESDQFAINAGYGKALASAFKKFMAESKPCETKWCKIIRKISSTLDEHPPLKDRIENAMKDPEIVKKKDPKSFLKFISKKG